MSRRVVVVNGFHRTASTKCYYSVQRILERKQLTFVAAGSELAEVDALIAAHLGNSEGPDWLVLKAHRWMPVVANPAVTALFTTRNFADVAVSNFEKQLRRRHETPDIKDIGPFAEVRAVDDLLWQIFFHRYCRRHFDLCVVEHEKFAGDDASYIRQIAEYIGLSVDTDDIAAVSADIDARATFRRTTTMAEDVDAVTQYRRDHMSSSLGRPGAYRERQLPPLMASIIDRIPSFVGDVASKADVPKPES